MKGYFSSLFFHTILTVDTGIGYIRISDTIQYTRLITMRSKPNCFEVAFLLLLLFFCLMLWQMSPWTSASVRNGPRNLSLKFGKNRVSNSWDIPDMDKCRQDKCCPDSWDIAEIEFVWVVVVGGLRSFSCQTQFRLC